jgi:hypothetical protein
MYVGPRGRAEDQRGRSRTCRFWPRRAPTWDRLEDQIAWDDRKSRDSQRWYKVLKLIELGVAAALPVVAGLHSPVWVPGGLAAVIVVLKGSQHLHQPQKHWTLTVHGGGAEARTLPYLAEARPYVGRDRHGQLAERLEGLSPHEYAMWAASHQCPRARSEDR